MGRRISTDAKREVKWYHGLITLVLLAIVMFGCVVGLGSEPQVPLVVCLVIAGLISLYLGFTWERILTAMINGIVDALEAIMILMSLGMLIGVWIKSGTVPTLIYYGLAVINADVFLPVAFLVCAIISVLLGSWGTAGTIGVALMGIGGALGIPLGMAAGAVISGCYVGEVISPFTDGAVMASAVARCNTMRMVKKFAWLIVLAVVLIAIAFFVMSLFFETSGSGASGDLAILPHALQQAFDIGPITLLPVLCMLACILLKMPSIPAILVGVAAGVIEAIILQGVSLAEVVEVANVGVVSDTGFPELDALLSNGGIQSMMGTISIVFLAMAFGGIMVTTGLMRALVAPVSTAIKKFGTIVGVTVVSGGLNNVLLPDDYLAMSTTAQMYGDDYREHHIDPAVLGNIIGAGATVTAALVPWNTCGVYMTSILGVATVAYAPYALFCFAYPVMVIIVAALFGRRIGWTKKVPTMGKPNVGLH